MHYGDHKRVYDILAVSDDGEAMINASPGYPEVFISGYYPSPSFGQHGFDDTDDMNEDGVKQDMRAIFIANGPKFKSDGSTVPWIKMVDEYQVFLMALNLEDKAEPNNGTKERVQNMFSPATRTNINKISHLLVITVYYFMHH